MTGQSVTTTIEDIVVAVPVDRGGAGSRPTRHRTADVAVPAGDEGSVARWTALFLAFLHRCTTDERIHLVRTTGDDTTMALRLFAVAGSDTVAELTARVDADLSAPATLTRIVTRPAAAAQGWSSRVLAGPVATRGTGDDGVDIHLLVAGGRVTLYANEALWTRESVDGMAGRLSLLASAPDGPLGELPMVSAAERATMLLDWNASTRRWPDGDYLALVRRQVALRPDAPAVVHEGRTVSYAELESRTNRIARLLTGLGAAPGERVGLLSPSSGEFVVAAVGVLKTGAAVVPLDPANPSTRLATLIADAAPLTVITTAALRDRLPEGTASLLIDDTAFDAWSDEPVEVTVTADTVSHLIYTSGSTGTPKAVLERHGALVNLVHWTGSAYGVRDGDRASWLSTPGFAVQLMEWMPYLALGVPVHVGQAQERTAEQLRDWLLAERVTHCMLVAALAQRVWALPWPADAPLRIMVTTAERVHSWPPVDTPFRVVMTYGSTETTNALTCLDIGAGVDLTSTGTPAEVRAVRPVPVGRPIANVRAYVLDPRGTPVPVGVVGRLHVAGAGLAAGYYRRPELTAEKFLANTVPEEPGPVLYDSGDLARYRADGAVELLGRADSQVKIRGFRVEIGEVEKTVNAAPGVAEVVVATYEPSPGDLRLVAYVASPGAAPVPAEVRTFVTERLPHYMVPSLVMTMDKLPRLANGKVDHRSLPAPEESVRAGLTTDFVEPTNPVEKELARIWAEILHVAHIGSTDNFFELGGHSLLAVRMVADAATTFNVELRLPDLCSHPTVGALAALIAANRSAMDQDAI